MNEKDEKRELARLNDLVAQIGELQLEIQRNALEYEDAVRPIKQQFEESVDRLTAERDDLMTEATSVMLTLIGSESLKGKSVTLRSGKVAVRDSTSITILDSSQMLRRARRLRIVRAIYDPREPQLNKSKLKALLKRRPNLAALLSSVVREDTKSRLTVTPATVQTEVSRDLSPLQAQVVRGE